MAMFWQAVLLRCWDGIGDFLMATIQLRGETWRVIFSHDRQQHFLTIGRVSENEARQWKSRVELLLMRLKQKFVEIPAGVTITDFVLHDGKPPVKATNHSATFSDLQQRYIATLSNGAIEANTLYTLKIHLNHIGTTLGSRFKLSCLNLAKLQEHIDRRRHDVVAVTIRKEITNFRAAWNWAVRMEMASGEFPSAGLVYPKGEEALPFMTVAEIERRIAAGGEPAQLWDAVYLDSSQIADVLKIAKKKSRNDWDYPMLATSAHTGARRSELLRLTRQDVDLTNRVMTITEQKRVKGMGSTRRVPISDTLAEVLAPLMTQDRKYLFGNGTERLTVDIAKQTWQRILRGTKWQPLPGYHVFRHSIASIMASKGIDQRIIDDLLSHSTESQRRRYRHLFPAVTHEAIRSVFG